MAESWQCGKPSDYSSLLEIRAIFKSKENKSRSGRNVPCHFTGLDQKELASTALTGPSGVPDAQLSRALTGLGIARGCELRKVASWFGEYTEGVESKGWNLMNW